MSLALQMAASSVEWHRVRIRVVYRIVSIPDLVRKAQDRSAYQRFVYRVAHARNTDTAP